MKVLACIVLAVLLVVASAAEDSPKDKRSVLGYSGWGYPGLGYSGLGYSGLGYSGLGYSGLGYSGLGYGYNYPWGYSGYQW